MEREVNEKTMEKHGKKTKKTEKENGKDPLTPIRNCGSCRFCACSRVCVCVCVQRCVCVLRTLTAKTFFYLVDELGAAAVIEVNARGTLRPDSC